MKGEGVEGEIWSKGRRVKGEGCRRGDVLEGEKGE